MSLSTKKGKKMKEAEIQTKFFKIIRSLEFSFEYPEAEWVHAIPNGARVSIGQAVKLKRQGLVSGVADVFVPIPNGGYHGMYIEFKTRTGRLSKTQDAFCCHCVNYCYIYTVCRDAVEAVESLREYLKPLLMKRRRIAAKKYKNTASAQGLDKC